MTTPVLTSAPAHERRMALRVPFHGSVMLEVGTSRGIETQAVNFSEHGLCLRVQEPLDINSRLRLQLRDQGRTRPVACQGRVSWVVQRLDLREAAPFVYDIGIEFIDPPNLLKRLATRLGLALIMPAARNDSGRTLRPAAIRNRLHVPRLTHECRSNKLERHERGASSRPEPSRFRWSSRHRGGYGMPGAGAPGHFARRGSPSLRWHLVITVEGVPCFSRRYASAHEALEAWRRFKREAAPGRPGSKS